jgi:hypothetical protein
MTKRDIIRFLERKQHEKTSSVREVYEATRDQLVKDTYTKLGLDKLAEKMQPLLEEAHGLWESWRKKHENKDGITFNTYYNSLVVRLDKATSSDTATYDTLTGDHVRLETKDLSKLYDGYAAQIKCVNDTFITVMATVHQMKSSKQAAAYLKELGFDLSELENPVEQVQTALMIPVDTRFLFVKAA